MIRGDVISQSTRIRRLCNGGAATVVEAAKPWLDFDVDGFPIPEGIDLLAGEPVARHVVGFLPPEYQGVDVRWQFTSQHGLLAKGRNARLRLSFRLDRPVSDQEAKALVLWINETLVAQGYRPGIFDPALYNPAQPHFIAPPICIGGMDFIQQRSGLIKGTTARVSFVARSGSGQWRRMRPNLGGAIIPAVAGQRVDDLLTTLRGGEPLVAGAHDFVRSLALAWGRENQLALARCRNGGEAEALVEGMAVLIRQSLEDGLSKVPADRATELHERLVAGNEVDSLLHWVIDNVVGELKADGSGRLHISERAVPGEWRDATRKLRRLEGAEARRFAWAMAERFQHRCPKLASVEQFQQGLGELLGQCEGATETDVTELKAYIATLVAHRRQRVEARFDLKARIAEALGQMEMPGDRIEFLELDSIDEAYGIIATRKDGVYVVRAPHGLGKTQQVLKPLAKSNANVLAVCHRRSLTRALSEVLSTAHYQDGNLDPSGGKVSTCIDSFFKPSLKAFRDGNETLLIDEIDQTLGALHSRSQVKHKSLLSHGLLKHIAETPLVVGCDADISTATLAYLLESGRKVVVIDVKAPQATPDVMRLPDKAVAMQMVREALQSGKRVRVVADHSADRLRDWDTLAQQEGLKPSEVALVCSETAGDYAALMRDINTEIEGLRLLAHSPSIGSGVSITRKHFDLTVALYTGTVSPEDFVQMIRRDRTAECIHLVLVGNNISYLPEGMDVWLRSKIEPNEAEARQKPIPQGWRWDLFNPYTLRCAGREAEVNRMTNDGHNNLLFLMEHRGWRIEQSALDDETDLGELRARAREVRELTEEQYVAGILGARDIDQYEFERLKKEKDGGVDEQWDPDTRLAWKKLMMRVDLGIGCDPGLTEADVRFHDHGKIMDSIHRLEQLLDPEELLWVEEAWDLVREPHAQRNPRARQARYKALMDALGVDLEKGVGRVTAESALAGWQLCVADKACYESFGIRVPAKAPGYPIKWARGVLAGFGVRLGRLVRLRDVVSDENGGTKYIGDPRLLTQTQHIDSIEEMERFYEIDQSAWRALNQVVLRRRPHRLADASIDPDELRDVALYPQKPSAEQTEPFFDLLVMDMDADWFLKFAPSHFADKKPLLRWCQDRGLADREAQVRYFTNLKRPEVVKVLG